MHYRTLFLGNETRCTDDLVSALAKKNCTTNRGLICKADYFPNETGYYHTTVIDLNEGQIKNLADKFDNVTWLDQPQDSYPHFKTFIRTFRLIKNLEESGIKVDYLINEDARRANFWWNYLRCNPSFCFQPFLALVPDTEKTNICPKNKIPIKKPEEITNWRTDPDYRMLRDPMLRGEKLPAYCYDCYDKECRGIESARQFETFEWAIRMKFDSPADFNQVDDPIFYEIRPSNKCNLMCRMCDDARSHLIEQERIQLKIELTPYRFRDLPFTKIKLDTVQRIYVGGGEPTIMPEFYQFLENCISHGRTDFELCIGTNGMKFSNKLIDLLDHFSDVLLSFSFDGYDIINDYIRWRSDFTTIVQNARMIKTHGHKIGLQTVPSMYNVTRLHEIFEFYDQEFPGSSCLLQAANGHGGILLPWNHPRSDLVIESLQKCKQTNQYLMSGRSLKGYVDGLYTLYSNPNFNCNLDLLKKFFEFNDMMDRARGSSLGDYIPELEDCRDLVS